MPHNRRRSNSGRRRGGYGQVSFGQRTQGPPKGATGADQYAINRLARAQTYLRGTGFSPGVIATLALSPLDDRDLDEAISALGGTPGHGYGIADLMDTVQEGRTKPAIAPSDIFKLKQNLINEGWVHPDTPIDSTWKSGDPFWQGMRNMEDFARRKERSGAKTGSLSTRQAFSYLQNFLPSQAWRGLRGFAETMVKDTAGAFGRAGINIARIPGQVASIAAGDQEEYLAKTRQIEKRVTGKDADDATFANDVVNIVGTLVGLRAAGVIGQGARNAAVGAAQRGVLKAAPGVRGGTKETLMSMGLRKIAPQQAMMETASQIGKGGYRGAARRMLAASDAIARAKSTPLGQLGLSITNAGIQTSISARALGAAAQGEILPNVDVSNIKKSRLTQLIDETPALGSSLKYEVFGKENPFGNPVDLTAFIWNPTQSLPFRMGQLRNGLTNLVGYDHVRPLARYFRAARGEKVTRASLIEEIGGPERLSKAMRYFRAQAAAMGEASQRLKTRNVPEDKWETAFPSMLQKVKAEFKQKPDYMENMMSQVNDTEMTEALRYFFKEYPETVAARNGGAVDLRNWYDTMEVLGEIDVKQAKVQKFVRGTNLWAKEPGNAEALDEAYQILARQGDDADVIAAGIEEIGEGFPGYASKLKFKAKMQKRYAQELQEGELAYARADNPVATAQDRAAATAVFQRLSRVSEELKSAMNRSFANQMGEDINVLYPRKARISDLHAAGIDPGEVNLNPAVRNYLTIEQAEQLNGSITRRLDEIRSTFNTYIPETSGLPDDKLIRKMKRLTAVAGRAVDLPDEALQEKMLAMGKRPIVLNKNALTLRDVDPGNIVDTLGEGSRLSGVSEWLGIHNKRITNPEIAQLRTAATKNELDQVAKEYNIAPNGEELMAQLGRLRDELPDQRTRLRTPGGRGIWKAGQLFDLRQIKLKDMKNLGWDDVQAEAVYAAVRRGAAFGFEPTLNPLLLARRLAEPLRINGVPGIEDALRTLVSANRKLGHNKLSRQVLNIPEGLARTRDFVQFQLSPYFTLGNMVEAKLLKGSSGLPMDLRPGKVKGLAKKYSEEFGEEFAELQNEVMGFKKAQTYATTLDETRLGEHGFFGFSTLDAEAVDTWRLYQRQKAEVAEGVRKAIDYQEIRGEMDRIYRYGPRSALEKSANYIFFPLSFNLKMGRALSDWFIQAPARILMVDAGMKMYDELNRNHDLAGKAERYLPILRELNKLNVFARGLGVTTGPLGGRNKLIERTAKTVAKQLEDDPAIGAFIPVGFTSDDYAKGKGLMDQLMPLFRQVKSMWDAAADQYDVVTKKSPLEETGSKEWQVDNYYMEMRELKDYVENQMAELGLKPSMQSLSSKEVNPEFREAITRERARIALKYPAGDQFADAYADDLTDKGSELIQMAENPVKSRAEANLLYLAAQIKQIEIRSHMRAEQKNSFLRRTLPGRQLSGVLADESFTDEEVNALRSLATRFARQDKEFIPLYKRYFAWELGPITLSRRNPGTAA